MQKIDRNTRILLEYCDYLRNQAALWRRFYNRANACLKEVEKDKEALEDKEN